MCLLDCIKQKHSKSFFKEAVERISSYQFSCSINKPFFYFYSLDMMNKDLEKADLFISKVKKHNYGLIIIFTVSRK